MFSALRLARVKEGGGQIGAAPAQTKSCQNAIANVQHLRNAHFVRRLVGLPASLDRGLSTSSFLYMTVGFKMRRLRQGLTYFCKTFSPSGVELYKVIRNLAHALRIRPGDHRIVHDS